MGVAFKAGILGGGLQGNEAACLARWAGWESVLADARPGAPAQGLTDSFVNLEIKTKADLDRAFRSCDVVIPACEHWPTLKLLSEWGASGSGCVAFDPEAYLLSHDKQRSKELFIKAGAPTPRSWPEASFPLIAKPVDSSGSRGVRHLEDEKQLKRLFPNFKTEGWIVEEYCPGPSYSLEISGRPGRYKAWSSTALIMDDVYDCRRVHLPTDLDPETDLYFKEVSLSIAETLKLRGLMDIEIILAPQGLRVLEIDARLPSQTPAVVLWGSGENLLTRLVENFLSPPPIEAALKSYPAVIYEHVTFNNGALSFQGEHVLSEAGILRLEADFFGADWAITDFSPERKTWTAALIICDQHTAAAEARRDEAIDRILGDAA